jgi:hypothetical protein
MSPCDTETTGSRIRGTVLRSVTTSTNPLATKDSPSTHTRWEITGVKRGVIAASDFETPSGYKVRDIRKMAGGLDSSLRSAIARDSGRSMRKRLCGERGM